jgi:hypothetical protein
MNHQFVVLIFPFIKTIADFRLKIINFERRVARS